MYLLSRRVQVAEGSRVRASSPAPAHPPASRGEAIRHRRPAEPLTAPRFMLPTVLDTAFGETNQEAVSNTPDASHLECRCKNATAAGATFIRARRLDFERVSLLGFSASCR